MRPVIYHPPTGERAPVPLGRFFEFSPQRTVEIGIGRADWIFRQAQDPANAERAFLGFEASIPIAVAAVQQAIEAQLPNLFIGFGDARLFLIDQAPAESIDAIMSFFPDPWPKTKHHRRRLTAPAMFPFIIRALKPDGRFRFRSDHPDLFDAALAAADSFGIPRTEITTNTDPAHAVTAWERKSLAGRSKGGDLVREVTFLKPAGFRLPAYLTAESPLDPREPVDAFELPI